MLPKLKPEDEEEESAWKPGGWREQEMKDLSVAGEASLSLQGLTMARVQSRRVLRRQRRASTPWGLAWSGQGWVCSAQSHVQDLFFPGWTYLRFRFNKAYLSNFSLSYLDLTQCHEYKNNGKSNPCWSRVSRRHTPLPMFFPVLISAARKALSKTLHDYVTRTRQASSGRHTGSNHFPFRNHKTPKVSTKHAMQAFYSGCCRYWQEPY